MAEPKLIPKFHSILLSIGYSFPSPISLLSVGKVYEYGRELALHKLCEEIDFISVINRHGYKGGGPELAETWFNKYGDRAVFFSRLLPVVRTFISLPAGIGRYELKKLFMFSFIGSLPWCFALAYVGFSLGPLWKNIIGFFILLENEK